ncbi:MAG TPA: ABC transporter permease [Armatimonadota bacterium]|nr:ABC transporter permease [Armatimonadota bacterium]
MKTIDVRKQPRLSIHRTFEICLNGIRYRFFRSLVTVVVITVAIAFLMNILCEALCTRAVAKDVVVKTEKQRVATFWTSRLSIPDAPETVLHEVASSPEHGPFVREAQQMAGMPDAEITAYHTDAKKADAYISFFNKLNYGTRRLLVKGATGTGILDYLCDATAFKHFQTQIHQMRTVHFPDSPGNFQQFLQTRWPVVSAQTLRIVAGRKNAVAQIQQKLQGRVLIDIMADNADDFGAIVRSAGFIAYDNATQRIVSEQAKQLQEMHVLEETIQNTKIRSLLAARYDLLPGNINTRLLWKILRNRSTATWFLNKTSEFGVNLSGLNAGRVVNLAEIKATSSSLDNAVQLLGGLDANKETNSRVTWLVVISLLVCAVGISNAMLMSVTERFREIATLKCLGALDGFIMMLFVMEASLLGLIGGIAGGLAGSIIGIGRMFLSFGSLLADAFPFGIWFLSLLGAILIGVVLAAVAGVYPSYSAARLAPMEAMRIE